jgi:HD-like signal output (HDOD) protein
VRGSVSVQNMKAAAIAELVTSARDLAVLPPSAAKLLQLSQNPRAEMKEIAGVVKSDPALAGKVLSVVNTPIYASRMGGAVTSIEKALSRIGLETLRGILIQTSLAGRVLKVRGMENVVRELTRHNVFAAAATRALARATNLDGELGFTIGLLHDVGKVVAIGAYASAPDQVKRNIAIDVRGLAPILKATHEEIGAHVAKTWSLAEIIQTSIGCHHTIGARHRLLQYPVLTKMGDLIAHHLNPAPDEPKIDLVEHPEMETLGFGPAAIRQLLENTKLEGNALASALS